MSIGVNLINERTIWVQKRDNKITVYHYLLYWHSYVLLLLLFLTFTPKCILAFSFLFSVLIVWFDTFSICSIFFVFIFVLFMLLFCFVFCLKRYFFLMLCYVMLCFVVVVEWIFWFEFWCFWRFWCFDVCWYNMWLFLVVV